MNNIGTIYQNQADIPKALEHFRASLKNFEDIGDLKGSVTSLNNIGSLYLKQSDFTAAEKYLQRSLDISRKLGYPVEIRNAAKALSIMYKATGKHELALENYELYITMRDSINNIETQKATIKQQTKYEFEKKELALKKEAELTALKFEYEKKQAAARSEQEKEQLRYEEELKRTQIEADYAQKQAAMEAEQKRKEAIAKAEQEKKDAIAAEQLKRKNQQRNAFIGGFALTLGLAGVSYRSYRRKKRDNAVITRQKEEVEHKNTEILASITYARRLQEAVLPPPKVVREFFNESFLLYLPRDIVSGDFYWMESYSPPGKEGSGVVPNSPSGKEGLGVVTSRISYFAVGDCTGHGVPGAMLSVMGLNGLNRALNELKLTEPKDLLTQLTKDLHDAFERNETTVRDGMDLALCALNTDTMTLTFCGANNPLWIARNGEMLQFKPNKRPVGFYDMDRPFGQETIQLQPGDVIYIHSDGYQDQLGGPEGKKFMTKKYRELLLSMAHLPMAQQRERLLAEHTEWRGTCGQTDDICVMGVRV
jgi:serine phosphatase RsbU (regulator of sigma subunit)